MPIGYYLITKIPVNNRNSSPYVLFGKDELYVKFELQTVGEKGSG